MWQCGSFQLNTAEPLIMGILNVTPDSFSGDGILCAGKNEVECFSQAASAQGASLQVASAKPEAHSFVEHACERARTMLRDGAHIIDVGGESTSPGSDEVSVQAELQRVLPVVEALVREGMIVSIDTRHAEVAAACVERGAAIINDVTGFSQNCMIKVAQQSSAGCIVMHMQGNPKNMQDAPRYTDVVDEVEAYLLERARNLEAHGIARARIAIDPGPGFGKDFNHNIALLKASKRLASHKYPLVAAWSRKRFIAALVDAQAPTERITASAILAAYAAMCGARIIRVHDVAPTVQALKAFSHLASSKAKDPYQAISKSFLCEPDSLDSVLCRDDMKEAFGGTFSASMAKRAFIGLGSNMKSRFGDPETTLCAAAERIGLLEGVRFVRLSSCYTSEPAYLKEQALFTNAVLEVSTTRSPHELLQSLLALEQVFGRERTHENGPRVLDCDLLDYEGAVCKTLELTLPHPSILERDFVVTPLLEIAPEHVLADGTLVTRREVSCGAIVSSTAPAPTASATALATTVEAVFSVCATPIGNLGDISLRVLDVLKRADRIYAEDTRVTRKLLSRYDIHTPLERCDEHSIVRKLPQLLKRLKNNEHVAYVTDAGMPGISDPGLSLVAAVRSAGYRVEVLPGASAALCALVASGFDAPNFYFGGFLPRTHGARISRLTELSKPALHAAALIFYESPHRVVASLKAFAEVFSTREICIARELTKRYEETLFGTASTLLELLEERTKSNSPLKGEIVIVVAPAPDTALASVAASASEIKARATELAATQSFKRTDIAKILVKEFGISREQAYEAAAVGMS